MSIALRRFLPACSLFVLWSCESSPTTPSDTTPPVLSAASPVVPAPNATNVPVGTTVQATFSEQLDAASVTGASFRLLSSGVPVTGTIAIAGTSVTFTPAAPLAGATTYTAQATSGIRDAAGNAFAGFTWSFTTIETTPPTVTSRTPDAGAAGIPLGAAIIVAFSEPVNPTTVTATTFTVTGPAGAVAGMITMSAGNTIATFTPTAPLTEFMSSYEVRVTTGVRDVAGNQMAADNVWSFETILALPNYWYRLTNQFLGEGRSLDTYFDAQTCFMGNTNGFTGQHWRLTPQGAGYLLSNLMTGSSLALEGGDGINACLLTGTTFTGQIFTFTKLAGGYLRLQSVNFGTARSLDTYSDTEIPYMAVTGNFSGQFWRMTRISQIETVAPNAGIGSPGAGAEDVSILTSIRIGFSEPMDFATVAAAFTLTGPDGPVAGTMTFNTNGDTAIFAPDEPLTEFATSYMAQLGTGARDRSGNSLASQLQWNFTTQVVSPDMWYRLSNMFLGETLSLDTYSDTYQCFMGDTGGFSGQYWSFEPLGDGLHRIRNLFSVNLPDGASLEGGDGSGPCLLTGYGPFTGQLWNLVPDNGWYRLQNVFLGSGRSLDTAGGTNVPYMAVTGAFSGQYWKLTRIGPM